MANESVRIPVELELSSMQKSLNQMKVMLKELKPGTAAYEELSKAIKKIDNDLISLTNRSKKAFSSQSEINSFAKSFDKVGLSMQDALEKFQRIDFKDLKIDEATPDGKAWKDTNRELSETINKIKKLQSSVLTNTDIIKPETLEVLKSLDASFDATKTSVEDCFKTLDKGINSTNKSLEDAEKKVVKYEEAFRKAKQKTEEEKLKLSQKQRDKDRLEEDAKPFEGSRRNKSVNQARILGKKFNVAGAESISDEKLAALSPEDRIKRIDEYYNKIAEAIQKKRTTIEDQLQKAQDAVDRAVLAQTNAEENLNVGNQDVSNLKIKQQSLTDAKQNLSVGQDTVNQEILALQNTVQQLNKKIADLEKKILEASEAMQKSGVIANQTGKDIDDSGKKCAKASEEYREMSEAAKSFEDIKYAVSQWFSFREVINMVKAGVKDAVKNIKELDSVMTEIAVVTDMSQQDLWSQIGTYSAVAQQYGVSTKGAYEVSMLWYQQGLQGAEVMDLTIETLKMAKIAGLDYATATDYMTVAIRGFKLEMEDAQRVTDVYSALAAATASSTEEIAVAMSKTASSAEAVGSSFESTSAMIATMISVTREAPENIGSALKSIISRYGEMTTDPTKMVDAEGEAMSLNKVDKALQSVGISLQDAKGQFRDFDDVILELAESWDTIDTNTQRYIATVMAGNRQQSRFLALVGNVDEYKKALSTASDAEGAGTIQYLKTMDSIESKIQQVKTAWEQFYSSMGIEDLFKGVLDLITRILTNLNKMGKGSALLNFFNIFKALRSLVKIVFGDITNSISKFFNKFKREKLTIKPDTKEAESWFDRLLAKFRKGVTVPVKVQEVSSNTNGQAGSTAPLSVQKAAGMDALKSYRDWAELNSDRADISQESNLASFAGVRRMQLGWVKDGDNTAIEAQVNMEMEALKRAMKECGSSFQNAEQYADDLARSLDNLDNEVDEEGRKKKRKNKKEKTPEEKARTAATIQTSAQIAQMLGAAISAWALTIEDSSEHSVERSKVASGVGQALSGAGSGLMMGLQVAGPWGALIGAILGALTGLPALLDGLNKTAAERIAQLKQEQQELENVATQKKGELTSLKTEIEDLKQLEKAQYDSEESMQAYKDKMNELGDKYPELIETWDSSGDVILELNEAERLLAEARLKSSKATIDALAAEYKYEDEKAYDLYNALNHFAFANTELLGTDFITREVLTLEDFKEAQNLNDKSRRKELRDTIQETVEYSGLSYEEVIGINEEDFNTLMKNWIKNPEQYEEKVYSVYSNIYHNLGADSASAFSTTDAIGNRLVQEDFLYDFELKASNEQGSQTVKILDEYFGLFASLGASLLDDQRDPEVAASLGQWRNYDYLSYSLAQNRVRDDLFSFIENISPQELQQLSSIYENLNSYKTVDELIGDLSFLQNDYPDIAKVIQDKYEEEQKENNLRYQKAVGNYWQKGSITIASSFYSLFDGKGDNELIGSYMDFVISSMQKIDSLAYAGLEEQRKALEDISSQFFSTISGLTGKTQADLLSIVSSIDWNDQASILKASYEIDDYIKEHGDDLSANEIEILNLVMEDLDTAYEDLTFNIATRIQNFNNALTENAEKVGSFLEKAAEGLDLTEAMNAFDSIAATNKDLTFDDVFVYDKELKKWVYTNEGLNKALEKQNEDLEIARQVRDDAVEDLNRFEVESAFGISASIDDKKITTNKTTFKTEEGKELTIFDSDILDSQGLRKVYFNDDGTLNDNFYNKLQDAGLNSEEIAQIEQLFLNYDPSSGIEFSEYVAKYYEDLDKALLDSEQLYLGFLQEKRNQWLGVLDLERLGAGATSGQADNLRQGITDILSAQGADLDKVIDGKNIIQYYTDEILSGNLAAMEKIFGEMSYEDKTSYLTGRTTAFTTAIDELFSTPGKVLSDTTIGLIEANGLGENLLNDSGVALNAGAHTLLFTAVAFYHDLVDSFERGYADIESVNAAAVSLLSGGLGIDKDAALAAVASNSSLSLDSLATLGNQFGFLLSDIISLEANSFGEGMGIFKGLIDYNEFTQTFDITGSFEDFISAIETVTGEYIDHTSAEYLQWYSDFVDSQVEKSASYYENITDEIGSLEEAGLGDSINFTYLGDALGRDAKAVFEEFGIEFNDGLATITEGADLAGFFNLLMNSEEFQDKLGNSFDEVQDSIMSVLEHWSDLIVDAFSGTLSFGDAEVLKGQLGLSNADFAETREGLQLTYEGAVKLHSKIQDIHGMPKVKLLEGLAKGFAEMDDKLSDGISAYKELKRIEEDILELGENGLNPQEKERLKDLREEKALVEDILAIRSTEASYNFMDKELPEYLQAPMSLWEGAAQAFSVIQENGGSLFSGTMGLQDFTNIITAMENFGVDFYATAKDSSGKVYQGADLLNEAYKYIKYVDGEAVIDLSEFGQNFIIGGEDAQAGLTSGIQELANFQIEMLDAAIAFLETIVAFEELGKVDIDNDGLIEMPELFKEGTLEKTDKHDEFLDELIKRAEENEDFSDALRSIQIGDKTLYDLLSEASSAEEDLTEILAKYQLTDEEYSDLLNSFYQASLSGDFDPETFVSFLPEELQELFAGSGLTFKIGEQEITFASDGTVYTFESEEDKKETTDFLKTIYGSEEYDYANLTHDQTVLVQSQENITVEETGNIVYTTSTGQKINLGSDPVSAATQVEEIKKMDSSGITEIVAETFTDEHGTETTVITGKHTNLKIGQDYTVTSTITPAGKVATVVGRTPSGETITGEGTTVEEAQANWVAQAVEKGEFNNTTEAYAHIGITINSTPELKLNLSQLSGEELSRIAQAYYSGDRELFAEVGFELGLFAEKPTFENEEELNTWVSENLPELSENRVPLNMVISFGDMTAENAGNYSTAFESIATNLSTISGLSLDSATSFVDSFETVTDTTVTNLESIKTLLSELSEAGYEIDLTYNIIGSTDQEGTYNVSFEDDGASTAIATLATSLATLSSTASSLATEIDNIEDRSIEVGNTADAISRLKDKSSEVGNTAAAIERLRSKNITASIVVKVTAPNPQPGSKTTSTIALSDAKGNVALAKGGAGSNKTLMGELGPELVVSNGHYFTVGNNGAEFVDLPSDAIVFNHLQTKKLLGAGGTVGTGEPITNERNAVAFASGNVTGPAKASASDTLSELYRIRALWQSLVDASAKDLATKAGSGGGGGGGGGGSDAENNKAYIHDLERWYNLMRQIAKLEQQVTLEQAKRENMRNGYDIAASMQRELELLEKQRAANAQLAAEQKAYYEQRRADLNSTDYSKIFTYDEDGLMQYVSGENRGLDLLATLNATDANGQAQMTAKEQLAYLESVGFDTSVLATNADGTAAETDEDKMQNFWDGIDGWMEEMDGLYDSYNDAAIAMEEATSAMNEILQEQIENQLTVENKILKAIEAREQAEIDAIQTEKEALEEAAQEYIDGLNSALAKERLLYEKNESQAETSRLQRQLGILQRSGGSAAEIKSLQDQINSRLQDAYFQEQQDQIDAIQ